MRPLAQTECHKPANNSIRFNCMLCADSIGMIYPSYELSNDSVEFAHVIDRADELIFDFINLILEAHNVFDPIKHVNAKSPEFSASIFSLDKLDKRRLLNRLPVTVIWTA